MKKILILFCGGTIIMERQDDGSLATKPKEEAVALLQRLEPRLQELGEISMEYIDNIDSTNITPAHWDRITNVIAENYAQYDGFVITHGTDTMAYTASALTFSLQNLGKPVVLTGAQIPGFALESDARNNLINSIRTALLDLSGVYIVFGDKVVLGARSSKVSESKLSAFATKNAPDAGEIRTEIRLSKNLPKRHAESLQAELGFENNVLVVTMIPGRSTKSLIDILEHKGTSGLIIRGYSTGNIPSDFLPVLQKAQDQQIPVVVTSQCLHGSTAMERYSVGAEALKLHTVQLYDMSIECAVTKFMWALKHFPYEQIAEVMQRSFVGEVNATGELWG